MGDGRLPHADARERLAALELFIRRVDDRIKDDLAADGERSSLEREYNSLHAALDFVDVALPRLTKCVCGKACHPSRSSAETHLQSLATITTTRPPRRDFMTKSISREWSTYRCFQTKDDVVVYHVGRVVRRR